MNVDHIGATAGKVWSELGNRGQTSLRSLSKHVGSDAATTQMAVGWLAREGKVRLEVKGKQVVVALTDTEEQSFMHRVG